MLSWRSFQERIAKLQPGRVGGRTFGCVWTVSNGSRGAFGRQNDFGVAQRRRLSLSQMETGFKFEEFIVFVRRRVWSGIDAGFIDKGRKAVAAPCKWRWNVW